MGTAPRCGIWASERRSSRERRRRRRSLGASRPAGARRVACARRQVHLASGTAAGRAGRRHVGDLRTLRRRGRECHGRSHSGPRGRGGRSRRLGGAAAGAGRGPASAGGCHRRGQLGNVHPPAGRHRGRLPVHHGPRRRCLCESSPHGTRGRAAAADGRRRAGCRRGPPRPAAHHRRFAAGYPLGAPGGERAGEGGGAAGRALRLRRDDRVRAHRHPRPYRGDAGDIRGGRADRRRGSGGAGLPAVAVRLRRAGRPVGGRLLDRGRGHRPRQRGDAPRHLPGAGSRRVRAGAAADGRAPVGDTGERPAGAPDLPVRPAAGRDGCGDRGARPDRRDTRSGRGGRDRRGHHPLRGGG